MKKRPILFSGAMVRALLAGTKTQTRRSVKPQPKEDSSIDGTRGLVVNGHVTDAIGWAAWNPCPYGRPGDRLWVRESWQGPLLQEFEIDADPDWHYASHIHQYQNPAHCEYAADGGPKPEYTDADDVMRQGWRPSIHMPRWASRITLEITGVRVERLQDISIEDAKAEGAWGPDDSIVQKVADHFGIDIFAANPRKAFQMLWEQINGPDSWDANPWVWAIEFKRLP